MKKALAWSFSFFLCISAQWLFWTCLRVGVPENSPRRFTSMSQHDVMSKERTAAAVRMVEPADADGFPSLVSWSFRSRCDLTRTGRARTPIPREKRKCGFFLGLQSPFLCAFQARVSHHNRFFPRCRAEWPPRPALGPRRSGSFPATQPVAAPALQGIRTQPEWILDRSGHRAGREARFEEWTAAPRYFGPSRQSLDCRACSAHELPGRRFDPTATWRVNFYRIEGATEPRFYSAWNPTRTAAPISTSPEAFGELVFVPQPMPRK